VSHNEIKTNNSKLKENKNKNGEGDGYGCHARDLCIVVVYN